MPALLVAGTLTRDQIRIHGDRWPQPGGAPWHAGLSLGPAFRGPADSLHVLGQAGPWASRFALPALEATGLRVWAARSDSDTIFVNDYRPEQRFQRLLSRARPLASTDLPPGPIAAAAVSPLYPHALTTDFVPALRERGTFVALDAQGLLRRVGRAGFVETVAPADLTVGLAGVQAVKFSAREFDVVPSLGRSHDVPATMFAGVVGVELLITHGVGGAQLFLPGGGSIGARTSASAGDAHAAASTLDTTGAGDVFLAAYAYARGGGAGPADALLQATEVATGLVTRRRRSAIDRRALIEPLRRLHACATWAARRVPAASAEIPANVAQADAGLFALDGPLARALAAQFPLAIRAATDPVAELGTSSSLRGAAQVGACWAMLTRGWPPDPALDPAALQRIAVGEMEAASRVRAALVA